MVVGSCYVLPILGGTSKGARQLHVKGSSKTCSERQFLRLLLFYYSGAHSPPTFHVMRRLQTQELYADCTCRGILGRRNRYALAAQTITETPVVGNRDPHADSVIGRGAAFFLQLTTANNIHPTHRNARRNFGYDIRGLGDGGVFRFLRSIPTIRSIYINPETSVGIGNPASKAPESGNGRTFLFYFTDAGQSITSSADSIKCVTPPCLAPVFDRRKYGNDRTFYFFQSTKSIIFRGKLTLGTPAANKRLHTNLKIYRGGSFLFLSGNNLIYSITAWSRPARRKPNQDAFFAQTGVAEVRDVDRHTVSGPKPMNFGTPVVQNSTLKNLRLRLRRVVSFSDIHTPCRPQFTNGPLLHDKQQRSVGVLSLSSADAFDEVFPMHGSHSWGLLLSSGREFVHFYDNLT